MNLENCTLYYLITAKPPPPHEHIDPGQICFRETRYESVTESKYLFVNVIGQRYNPYVCLHQDLLHTLPCKSAELLLALESNEDRLLAITKNKALQRALPLHEGNDVQVKYNDVWLKGVIRYIGNLVKLNPIAGVFFGIELQGKDKGKGQNDGFYGGKRYFKCSQDSGIFVPFTRIRTLDNEPSTSLVQTQSFISELFLDTLAVGDRVTVFGEKNIHGIIMNIDQDRKMVHISTDMDDKGKGGDMCVPLDCVFKEELLNKGDSKKMGPFLDVKKDAESEYTIGSIVQIQGSKTLYGTIRWIGYLPDLPEKRAGLELEESCGVNDGVFKGSRYFKCPAKCGLFVKLSSCQPDQRFYGDKDNTANGNSVDNSELLDSKDTPQPFQPENVPTALIGLRRGIQGHCNSCYMDSALFSLFSCSSVLDSMLFKSTNHEDEPIQKILLNNIVKPLRTQGFVSKHSVMKLRDQLLKRGHSASYTTDEKDPEEFLSLIMQSVLCLDPPLKLWSHSKGKDKVLQSCYFYQILMDYNNALVLPTVQQLLEHSFYINNLKLAEAPACLILTMPRSGKNFKMFPKIIPSLELDITGLLSDDPQQCVLCGGLASEECSDCFRDPVFADTGFKFFCLNCSTQVHSHPQRQSHTPRSLKHPQGFGSSLSSGADSHTLPREKLQLFAVLCIETSHYVSFVKYGPQDTDWIFFDSMADRVGETDGYNIPEVRACPEVAQYLEMPLALLANQMPREMKGVSKRLFCDGYMYLYQSERMSLYR